MRTKEPGCRGTSCQNLRQAPAWELNLSQRRDHHLSHPDPGPGRLSSPGGTWQLSNCQTLPQTPARRDTFYQSRWACQAPDTAGLPVGICTRWVDHLPKQMKQVLCGRVWVGGFLLVVSPPPPLFLTQIKTVLIIWFLCHWHPVIILALMLYLGTLLKSHQGLLFYQFHDKPTFNCSCLSSFIQLVSCSTFSHS